MAGSVGSKVLAAAALTTILCGAPLAQTVAHFTPASAAAPGEGGLALRVLEVGRGLIVWPAGDIGWLFVREEGTQRNYDALAPDSGDRTLLRLERETTGAVLVGWDRPPRDEPVSCDGLRAFVEALAPGVVLPQEIEALLARQTLLVRRLESLALVEAPRESGEPIAPSAVSTSKSGQRMELRPLLDPTFVAAGSDFVFRLHLPEGGEEQIFLRAVHLASGETRPVLRAEQGTLRAELDRAGPWRIEAHRLRRLESGADAALELASSTLVFDVSEAPARDGEGDGR